MRKRIATPTTKTTRAQEDWLDLERAATVEATSEDKEFPIESSSIRTLPRLQGDFRHTQPDIVLS